jgi:hypothetical protein
MVHCEDGERGLEGIVPKGQVHGGSTYDGRGVETALPDHGLGRLDRGDVTVPRFVRARARADIDNSARAAERRHNYFAMRGSGRR